MYFQFVEFILQGASKPADWKYQSYLDRWVTIATNVSIDHTCRVPVEVMCQSLLKQIQVGVTSVLYF